MRVATWNLERPSPGGVREGRQRRWFDKVDADVWVLTESHTAVSPGPAFKGAWSAAGSGGRREGEVMTAIWSRYPLTSLGPTSDPERSAVVRIEPPGSRPVIVYGTVLPWLGSPWNGFPSAGGVAFGEALRAQSGDWNELRREHPDCDLIVAGDLNQDLAPKHFYGSTKNRLALENALVAAGLRCVTAGDADPVGRQTEGHWASIDHICVSGELAEPVSGPALAWPEGESPDKTVSDHFGVLQDFG